MTKTEKMALVLILVILNAPSASIGEAIVKFIIFAIAYFCFVRDKR